MKAPSVKPVRCAIYTRVSTEMGWFARSRSEVLYVG
jgi:hypothetical protein